MQFRIKLSASIADLPPASFALVMATGIVSIACHLLGFRFLAVPLLWLNVVFYAGLWGLMGARMALFPRRLGDDLKDHSRGVGFFTAVAGTCVLGSQCVVIARAYEWAAGLLWVGIFLWAVLIYTVFTAFTVKTAKPTLEKGINGVWLVAVVATQSLSVLSGRVFPYFVGQQQEWVLFFSLSTFLLGGMFYLLIMGLIFYRFMFFSLPPEELHPSYWINMGAAAISTLAGATLVLNGSDSRLLLWQQPFILGLTLFFWAFATWWIPLLFLLSVWRYLVRRVKLSYNPQYWSVVFPLGMYTTCTLQLARAAHLDFLLAIPRYFIYAALLAWVLTFAGLLKNLAGLLRASDPHRSEA
jgi:tellurite resistance protein TehA-like permease